jgi:glutamate synthase domain-containing protein 1
VVHNGEISSYGINRRYLENFGYSCTLHTDTEVIAYLVDLLMRKHELPLEMTSKVLAPPFWSQVERMTPAGAKLARTLRVVYGGALLNGPFSIVVGHAGGMFGLNDRTKLRPMVAARKGDMLYISSEEAGIRTVCGSPDEVWHAEGGAPVVGRLKKAGSGGADVGEKAVA